jgi:hypothetical protein
MSYTPKRLAGLALSQYPKLKHGEASKTYRVRAGEDVHQWLANMTAEQRGEMLTEVYGRHTGKTVQNEADSQKSLTKAQRSALKRIRSENLRVQRGLDGKLKAFPKDGQPLTVKHETLLHLADLKMITIENE